jgi:GAF domain-containing protein
MPTGPPRASTSIRRRILGSQTICGAALNPGAGAESGRKNMSNGSEFDQQLRSAMAKLADNFPLDSADGAQETLERVTAAAVELIRGIDHADVLLIDDDRFESVAPTDPIAKELDDVQQRLQQGPCVRAALVDPLIRCTDLRSDSRWPEFASEATRLGIYSMLSVQLYTHRSGVGALNLLGREPHTFTQEAEALAAMLATHAALALSAVNTREQFASALASRDHIGQAKGILMERFDIDAVRAFELLTRLSQDINTPVREIAERVINTR